MSFSEDLRIRLKAAKKAWEKAQIEVKDAKAQEAKARDRVAALEVLLRDEAPKQQEPLKPLSGPVSVPLPVVPATEVNKAAALRTIIAENNSTGLTPAQISKRAAALGISLKTNYIYAVLVRGMKAGTITRREGKYFVAEERHIEAKAAS
jgi:hypothetical protein